MSKYKLNTEPYKGVRDFYPSDYFNLKLILENASKIARLYGYEQYDASILEPAELYKNKTSEEIVSEQTYSFTDRGDREVTLRPEMTPTVARMIAGKKFEISFPARWFSIPNLFRYERNQKGRFREHWQFNADIFGLSEIEAEVEIISLASNILSSLNLKENDYFIRLNSRIITDFMFGEFLNLNKEETRKLSRLIDKKKKISTEEFSKEAENILGRKDDIFLAMVFSKNFEEFASHLPKNEKLKNELEKLSVIITRLADLGIKNVELDPSLIRGFDYYTGVVFEFYDNDPENPRSLLGGGRYDKLFSYFGEADIPTVGFGMGDAVLLEALKSRSLLSEYKHPAKIAICILDQKVISYSDEMAQKLRNFGVSVVSNYSLKKTGEQIKWADKQKIPYIMCIGEDEVKSGKFKIKELKSGNEFETSEENLTDFFQQIK